MKTAEEVLREHVGSIFTYQEIDAWQPMLSRCMKAYAKEALEEAAKAGVIYTGDPIQYAEIDKRYIQKLITDLK